MLVMTELLLVMLPEARHERNVDSFGPLHVDIFGRYTVEKIICVKILW